MNTQEYNYTCSNCHKQAQTSADSQRASIEAKCPFCGAINVIPGDRPMPHRLSFAERQRMQQQRQQIVNGTPQPPTNQAAPQSRPAESEAGAEAESHLGNNPNNPCQAPQSVDTPAPNPYYQQADNTPAPKPNPYYQQPGNTPAPKPNPYYQQPGSTPAPKPNPYYQQPGNTPAPNPYYQQADNTPAPNPYYRQPSNTPARGQTTYSTTPATKATSLHMTRVINGRLVEARYPLNVGSNVIGRADASKPSDIQIEGDYCMSRRSADIVVTQHPAFGYVYRLNVLNATNPVSVNNSRIAQGHSADLHPGDTIVMGETTFVLA